MSLRTSLRTSSIALVLPLLLAACSAPAPAPGATPTTPGATAPAATSVPATAAPTPTTPPTAAPTAAPTPPPTPAQQTALDVHLWNGSAEVQVDGQPVQPGRVPVTVGDHTVSAVVNGRVVARVTPPPEGGRVDLVVPPPLSPLAVIIENQDEARPQSGLLDADIVYETLAEGGISRFMAVYMSRDSAMVGPVRSLRHYFAFLAGDFGADLIHIGASPEGFAWRDAMGLGKLDESAKDPGVFRATNRLAPHNAYTNTGPDRQFLAERGYQRGGTWGPLLFSSETASATGGDQPAPSIAVTFPPWPYHVLYTWDAASQRYMRFMNNAQHLDAQTKQQIGATSVIVQFANIQPIPDDDKLRVDMDLVGGSGRLLALYGGTQRAGTWSKDGPRDATQWRDADGQPLVLPPGPVWVEIVPLNSTVTTS